MAGRRILYILSLAGCFIFYGAYQKWFSWIVLLAVLLLPWFSLLLSLRAMLCTRLTLNAPERITAGGEAYLRISVRCPAVPPPVRYRIRAEKPITGETWLLRSGDRLPTGHCGGLLIRAEKAKVYDRLGLFRMNLRQSPSCIVRILPEPAEHPLPYDLSRHLTRAWRPKTGGGYAENHEIRPYRPGDSLNLVHWKLSAKTDGLVLREPMEPAQGRAVLTMDLNGTPDELDLKFSRLFSYGTCLLGNGVPFDVLALTGNGIETWVIHEKWQLDKCADMLLCTPYAKEGTLRDQNCSAVWQHHIGGEPDET